MDNDMFGASTRDALNNAARTLERVLHQNARMSNDLSSVLQSVDTSIKQSLSGSQRLLVSVRALAADLETRQGAIVACTALVHAELHALREASGKE